MALVVIFDSIVRMRNKEGKKAVTTGQLYTANSPFLFWPILDDIKKFFFLGDKERNKKNLLVQDIFRTLDRGRPLGLGRDLSRTWRGRSLG